MFFRGSFACEHAPAEKKNENNNSLLFGLLSDSTCTLLMWRRQHARLPTPISISCCLCSLRLSERRVYTLYPLIPLCVLSRLSHLGSHTCLAFFVRRRVLSFPPTLRSCYRCFLPRPHLLSLLLTLVPHPPDVLMVRPGGRGERVKTLRDNCFVLSSLSCCHFP